MEKEDLQKLIVVISSAIEALPNPPRESVIKEFEKIKEQVMENRPPRIMIVGRRGAGKSSLINAIFDQKVAEVGPVVSETGESEWHYFKNNNGNNLRRHAEQHCKQPAQLSGFDPVGPSLLYVAQESISIREYCMLPKNQFPSGNIVCCPRLNFHQKI